MDEGSRQIWTHAGHDLEDCHKDFSHKMQVPWWVQWFRKYGTDKCAPRIWATCYSVWFKQNVFHIIHYKHNSWAVQQARLLIYTRSRKEYWLFINFCIWVDEWRLVYVCQCVCVRHGYCLTGDNGRLQYLKFCLSEMYVNVFFVIRCLYGAVSLTVVREQRFIRIIYY